MFTDWILIERLALELDAQTARSRVTALGQLRDGRVALEYWRRGTTALIVFDLFGRVPSVTLESGELEIAAERGFIRTAGAALRGLTLRRVSAVPGERILSFEFATRSRFGVTAGYRLAAELIPRFGNLLLLKDDTIVTAYKEFRSHAGGRKIAAGMRYEAPPAKAPSSQLPRLLAASAHADESEQLLEGAQRAARSMEDLFVYRDGEALVQAHVVPLHQFDHLDRSRAPALLPLLREIRVQGADTGGTDEIAKRRRDLAKKLEQQERRLQSEFAAVDKRLASVANRDAMRHEAESIFATLHQIDKSEHPQAKAKATELFARYKRLNNSAAPLEKRRKELAQRRSDLEVIAWELQRAGDDDLLDVGQAVERFLGSRARSQPATHARKKRSRIVYQTKTGSRILVGRSPVENADLTFAVARPNDFWFHARNTPGAHVILQRGDRAPPPAEDLELAASLAAYFSRAKESPKVNVDYTLRKHVRKRPSAAPGLVFYTEAKTLIVAPRSAPDPADVQ